MEASVRSWLENVGDKIETRLFGTGQTALSQEELLYFRSFFTPDSYDSTRNLAKYFKDELCLGFVFNLFLLGVLVLYLPFNIIQCWECNYVMTLWLGLLSTLNTILILPKALLIRKLFRVQMAGDASMANFAIWSFFRSRVYKFNNIVSRCVLMTYLFGMIIIFTTNWVHNAECDRFRMLIVFFLVFFVVRFVTSLARFMRSFGTPQQAEDLLDLFSGISSEDIQSLKVFRYEEYHTRYARDDTECSICCEEYDKEDKIRMMECPGQHVFHMKCIDKWLIKSDRCPKCNMMIFWQNDQAKKEE